MKLFDTKAFDDTKCVINKTDLKCRWCEKSVDSCLPTCAIKILATTGEMQDPIGAPKTC